jgi:hypothetical protein
MASTPPAFSRNSGDVLAEIAMTRTSFAGAMVLVEGPSDSRFLSRHLDLARVQLVICGGKGVVLAAIEGLSGIHLTGCVGIIDLDFDHHLHRLHGPNVISTETHDVETLLLSVRLKTILSEYGDRQKIEAFEAAAHQTVSEALLERASKFAQLRYINEVSAAFEVSFSQFSPWKYTDSQTWTLDESRLFADFAAACNLHLSNLASFSAAIPNLQSWRDVQGHDSLAIICIGLKKILGPGKQVSEEILLTALRLSFSEQDFRSTQLYSFLTAWESSPSGRSLFG